MKLLLIVSLFFLNSVYANVIHVTGNTKTSNETVIKLSRLNRVKGKIEKKHLKEATNNLLRSGLFLDASVINKGNKTVIKIEEKWTTIPILKGNSGGGVSEVTVGIFDPNVAGEALEFGGQYTRLGDTNSGVLWHKNPLVGSSRVSYDVQLWKINRLRTKYDQFTEDPVAKNGFLQTRDQFLLGLSYQFDPQRVLTFTTEYHKDTFSDELVPEDVTDPVSLPPASKFQLLRLTYTLDKFDYGPIQREGYFARVSAYHAIALEDNLESFQTFEIEALYNKRFGDDFMWANRFTMGGTNTETLQYWFYKGGLASIRGFLDNRFAGKNFALLNTELRKFLYHHDKFILQGVSFLDLINIEEKFDPGLTGASAGLGFRVILPQFYRFVIRMDYARPLEKDDDNFISFGVQQFF